MSEGVLQVATALIVVRVGVHDRVLLQQRAVHREFPLFWECPGGKLEEGESREDCVRRELHEELALEVRHVSRALLMCAFEPPTVERACDVSLHLVRITPQDLRGLALLDAVGVGLFDFNTIPSLQCVPSCYGVHAHVRSMGGLKAALEAFEMPR